MAERVAKVETEVKNLKDRNTSEHAELKAIIEAFMESSNAKFEKMLIESDAKFSALWTRSQSSFAGKPVETLVYGVVKVILTAIVLAGLGLIIIK